MANVKSGEGDGEFWVRGSLSKAGINPEQSADNLALGSRNIRLAGATREWLLGAVDAMKRRPRIGKFLDAIKALYERDPNVW